MKKFDLIEITWIDSHHSSGWRWDCDIDWEKWGEKGLTHKTAGYYIGQSKNTICVVQSFQLHDKDEDFCHDARMCIPKVAIKKKRKLST